jgi:hypothetical protein
MPDDEGTAGFIPFFIAFAAIIIVGILSKVVA